MTDKQKQAIMVINALFEHCGEKVFNYDDYFLLLDFIVGQSPIINVPFQREEPFKPITWERPFWDDGITCSEPIGERATSGFMQPKTSDEPSITESIKAKEDGMSYGDRLIKEGRSPL